MDTVIETPSGRFTIRPYAEGDRDGILSMWKAAFGKEMSPRLWDWKWLENPYGHQILLCVTEEDVPVAVYSGIPYRANDHGETVRFTHLMDHCSHPAFRGTLGGRSGMFVRTAEKFFNQYGGKHASVFMYGLPGKRHFLLGEKLLHYVPFRGGMAFMSTPPSEAIFRVRMFRGRLRPVDSVSDAFDALAEASRKDYPFSVLRDAAFLRWRFAAHPERKYEIWVYRPFLGRSVKAYAVLFHEPESTCIVDLVAPDDVDGLRDFLARLVRVMREKGVQVLKTWLPPGHFLSRTLVSGGFKAGPEPIGFIPGGRTFHEKLDMARVSDLIFCTMADGDLI